MNDKIKAIVIDDELLARKRVSNLLLNHPDIEIIAECGNGKKAIEMIKSKKPDLILLDIQMKDMTGFDVLNQIEISQMPSVVFVTAYDEFALKAFDYFAVDYVLKPFKNERFLNALEKTIKLFHSNQLSGLHSRINKLTQYLENSKNGFPEFKNLKFSLKSRGKHIFIDKESILYIQASGYYAEIYTDNKKHLLRESLNALITELDCNIFFRIHRSTIINISWIKEIIYSNYGEIDVKMSDEKLLG